MRRNKAAGLVALEWAQRSSGVRTLLVAGSEHDSSRRIADVALCDLNRGAVGALFVHHLLGIQHLSRVVGERERFYENPSKRRKEEKGEKAPGQAPSARQHETWPHQ